MNPDTITVETIYKAMNWKDRDLWLGECLVQNWDRLCNGELDLKKMEAGDILEELARRSGRTTQLCVKAVLKALEGKKVLICAPHITTCQQIEFTVNRIWQALNLRAGIFYWIKTEAIGNKQPNEKNLEWADTVLEDHTCEFYK